MREIKFRAWDKIDKKMRIVEAMKFIDEHENPRFIFLFGEADEHNVARTVIRKWEEVELLQYTGLKDKNGKEIWEGDIVWVRSQYETDEPVEGWARVFFREGSYRIDFYNTILDQDICEGVGNWNLEKIGNIYENPELLEEKQNEKKEKV